MGLDAKYKDADNAGKLLVMFNKDKEHAPDITQLEGNQMHEMFLLLSEPSNTTDINCT